MAQREPYTVVASSLPPILDPAGPLPDLAS